MKHVWTWGGIYFGYIESDDLWTYDGRHVGKRVGDDIYRPDGQYLGEVMNGDHLITNNSKRGWTGPVFMPYSSRVGYVPAANHVGYVMYAGYEDFPSPDEL